LGSGRGCGLGRGRGNRNMFKATGVPGWMRAGFSAGLGSSGRAAERQALASQAEALQRQLDGVRKRLEQLGDKS